MTNKINIAIDGPGAAGKSTIAKLLAKRLNYVYLDTGAMYRCAALAAFQRQIAFDDDEALASLMENIDIAFDENQRVFLNGVEVSQAIRTNDNSMRASLISQNPIVRKKLVEKQQEIAQNKGCILDGRDIGTVVLPDAELKVFLIANAESRAQRRYKELQEKGQNPNYEAIKQDLIQRDYQDSHRQHSPLKKAEDAKEVDTSDMSIVQVEETLLGYVADILEGKSHD